MKKITQLLAASIKERDRDCCTDCGIKEGERTIGSDVNGYTSLIVHHLDGNRANNKRSNLTTLCKRCHRLRHTRGQPTIVYLGHVQYGLEAAREILSNPRGIEAWEHSSLWHKTMREKAIGAIEKALDHYKKEAERVKKYKEAPKNG